jgi:hypothetical protein
MDFVLVEFPRPDFTAIKPSPPHFLSLHRPGRAAGICKYACTFDLD